MEIPQFKPPTISIPTPDQDLVQLSNPTSSMYLTDPSTNQVGSRGQWRSPMDTIFMPTSRNNRSTSPTNQSIPKQVREFINISSNSINKPNSNSAMSNMLLSMRSAASMAAELDQKVRHSYDQRREV